MTFENGGDNDVPVCVTVILAYVTLLGYLVFLAYQFVTRRSSPWEATLRNLRFLWSGRSSDASKGHAFDLKVRETVERERVRCVQQYSGPLAHLTAWYVLCLGALQLCRQRCSHFSQSDLTFEAAEEVEVVGLFILCSLFAAFPRLVTIRAVEATYIVFSAWWIVRVMVVGSESLALAAVKVPLWRAAMGILVCNVAVTGVCNFLVMAVHCLAFALRADDLDEQTPFLVLQEIGTTVFIYSLLVFVQNVVWASCRHTWEIKASSQAEVTVRRLLSALCDAVVTLGPDLRISARAPKLAYLLLQGRSTSGLEGVHFLDFMADTDQDRFRQFLARAPDHADSRQDPEPAQALNVHLRDSSGITVQVQLFHSHFQDLNEKVCHLIGICEVGDTGGGRIEGCPPQIDHNLTLRSSSPHMGMSVDSIGTFSDSETIGDSASVICARPQQDIVGARLGGSPVPAGRGHSRLGPRELALTFDTMRFKVNDRQSSSHSSVIDANLLEKETLLQWVVEWSSTRSWMQDFVNAVLRPVNQATWPSRAGPPSTLSFQVSFRGSFALPPDILTRTSRSETRDSVSTGGGQGGGGSLGTGPPNERGRQGPPMRCGVGRMRLSRARSVSARAREGGQLSSQMSNISSSISTLDVQRLEVGARRLPTLQAGALSPSVTQAELGNRPSPRTTIEL